MLKFKVDNTTYEHSPVIPQKAGEDEVGYDLTCISKCKDLTSTPGKVVMYDTGISVQPPDGYYTTIVPRSSIVKSGYMLTNSIGIIDPTYRGTLRIVLTKVDDNAEELELPFCKCQLIVSKFNKHVNGIQVEELTDTIRGEGGFGSTDNSRVLKFDLESESEYVEECVKSCNITILRHAERNMDDASIKSHLNEMGHKTSNNLKFMLPTVKTLFFSSPYVRCVQTLEKCRYSNKINIDLNLREFHEDYNTSAHEIYTELNKKYQEDYIFETKYNHIQKLYNSNELELEDEMKERCKEFKSKVGKIIRDGNDIKNIIICTHGRIADELIYLFTGNKFPMLEMGMYMNISYEY